MNLGIPASIIRMPFLSASFNKFELNDWANKSYIQIKVPPPEITTTNKPVIELVLSNQFYHLQ